MNEKKEAEQERERADRKRWIAVQVRRTLLLLVTLLGLAGIVYAWLPKPVPVDIASAERGALRVTVDEDGRTRVKDRYIVSAPLLANLARIELRPGDRVEPGTILARLMPLSPALLDTRSKAQAEARVAGALAARRQAEAGVKRVRTALEFAQTEAARERGLLGSGASAARNVERTQLEERTRREDLASAEFAARVAGYELEMTQAALGRLSGSRTASQEQLDLTSPVKGRVLRVIQQSEGAVQPGTPLLEIGDSGALEIVVDVLTGDAVNIPPSAQASIERWGGEKPLRAHVRLVEPSAFTRISALGVEEQRVNVVLDLDEPSSAWAALGDGYRVEARIVTWEAKNVLSVPSSAVFRRGDTWSVFAVKAGDAQLRTVDVGHRNSERLEITRGLAAGERVILHPSDRVSDGASVVAR